MPSYINVKYIYSSKMLSTFLRNTTASFVGCRENLIDSIQAWMAEYDSNYMLNQKQLSVYLFVYWMLCVAIV